MDAAAECTPKRDETEQKDDAPETEMKMIRFRGQLSLKVPRRHHTWGCTMTEHDLEEHREVAAGANKVKCLKPSSLGRRGSNADTASATTTDREDSHDQEEEDNPSEAGDIVLWPDTDSEMGDLGDYNSTYAWGKSLHAGDCSSCNSTEPPSPAFSTAPSHSWEPWSPLTPVRPSAMFRGPCMQPAMPAPMSPAQVLDTVSAPLPPHGAPPVASPFGKVQDSDKKNGKRAKAKMAAKTAMAEKKRGSTGKGRDEPGPVNGEITTVMIRNLPKRLNQQDFLSELDACGFKGKFDFCYLPRDFSSGRSKGYAFLNFGTTADAAAFTAMWHKTRRLGLHNREQALDVSAAHIQGYEANVKVASSSSSTEVRNPDFRRFVLDRVAPSVPVQVAALPPPTPAGKQWSEMSGAAMQASRTASPFNNGMTPSTPQVPPGPPVTIFQLLGAYQCVPTQGVAAMPLQMSTMHAKPSYCI